MEIGRFLYFRLLLVWKKGFRDRVFFSLTAIVPRSFFNVMFRIIATMPEYTDSVSSKNLLR